MALKDCQFRQASGKLKIETVIDCQTRMVPVISCRVSAFVSKNDAANTGAEANMIRWYRPWPPAAAVAGCSDSLGPTTTNTPTKPMATASQRSQCMGSRKNKWAPTMMKIGPVKPMAVMSASGIFGRATNHKHSPSVCKAPRVNCPPICLGR